MTELIVPSDELIKIFGLSTEPINYIGRYIGQKNTKHMRFKIRQHIERYVKSLGLDIECITSCVGKRKEDANFEIIGHKNDPFIDYRYIVDVITFDLVLK